MKSLYEVVTVTITRITHQATVQCSRSKLLGYWVIAMDDRILSVAYSVSLLGIRYSCTGCETFRPSDSITP